MPDPCQNWPCSTTNDRNNSHSIPDDWEKATENGRKIAQLKAKVLELDSQVNMLGSKDTINSNLNLSSRPIILNQNRIVNQTDKQAFRPKKILQRPKVEETKETSVM
ncbi:hypothetical protein GJ496_004828 [Pomphorhynchus laevis]|nr:hypothetical protein GJ496_004828 [Pomphorhynchus laevis]